MNAQEEANKGMREAATGSGSDEDEQFKGPLGWYIMQAITGLEQSLRSDREYFRADSKSLNNKIDNDISALNTKIDNGISALNTKIDNDIAALNTKIDNGIAAVNARIDKLTYWAIGIVVGTAMTGIGVIVTVVVGALYVANHIR